MVLGGRIELSCVFLYGSKSRKREVRNGINEHIIRMKNITFELFYTIVFSFNPFMTEVPII